MESSTTKTQRIIIWGFAIVMLVGTIGSFAVLIIANDNQNKQRANESQSIEEQLAEYEAQLKIAAQENAENSRPLEGYEPTPFNADDVKQLGVKVLKSGTGDEVAATDSISASYFGWMSDGTVFDSSFKKDAASDEPIPFPLMGVIQGWSDGLKGQRVGSVVELTIPSDLAYRQTGSGIIPPNAPLKFVIIIHDIVTES
ncbi:MAG TPA: FKBP-type peptidyl-prolyl cis-trans isomerase [Candidatus Saccharibacteria bacterium]|nr:FKBP-type peptidyl-prolyl cis-trans isomerase [Candidatus Saccharibacteria bacterium]